MSPFARRTTRTSYAGYCASASVLIIPSRQRLYAAGPSRSFAVAQADSIECRSTSLSIDRSGRAGSAARLATCSVAHRL
jgi:hypothetical protein